MEFGDGRVFQPDSGNPHVTLSSQGHTAVSDPETSLSNHSNLYTSAQVFRETSSYTVNTKQIGRHWLRLHFYPFENPKFNLKSAVFSVVANGITLLHGFSFSKVGQTSHLVKEYVFQVDGTSSKKLVLTLSPWNGSIAFINGIEVVSVPDGQFPSTEVMPVPLGPAVDVPKHVTFETAYRINMGGQHITPKNDSLWRTWDQTMLFLSMLLRPGMLQPIPAESNTLMESQLKLHQIGFMPQLKRWRMHRSAIRNLTFHGHLKLSMASAILSDCIFVTLTMALSAAYFTDFVTNVSMGSNRILVQVGPPMLRDLPSNAILNGLEIMKNEQS
ncbi:receptor-like protein kinase THESEUS 1 [Prunus yedoensis var. nudiflora]|uniref:Receptor-like protein kinase THESEUS 1 n=1 Tax=Prunus yedoensis var. nudiflora TaxID=2094558 RepID=A0A314ZNL9_PRUYE|nr:receptor-like protein kinase THESEUS 1 [Prunus yedoensis var. nudiflora]